MSAALALELEVLADLRITRYVSAAGLVILLYDHVLSLSDEVRFIWSARVTSSKVLFLALRYLVPCVMLFHTNLLDFLTSTFPIKYAPLSSCCADTSLVPSFWMTLAVLVGWLTLAINNWLVLLRLWVLWGADLHFFPANWLNLRQDRHRTFIVCTLLIFIALQTTTVVLAWIGVANMMPSMAFQPELHLCSFTYPPKYAVVWIPGLSFELMVLSGMGWKVLNHPQTLKTLHGDGYIFFLCLSGNLTNTIIFFTVRTTLTFVTLFFMWCFTTTTTCRMILSLRHSADGGRLDFEPSDTDGSDISHETQFTDVTHRRRRQLIELRRITRLHS
ncbi:hypothetical protein B0H11DRAFT_2236900 [Mycena galericulata]|nr:hypothetical protein B0H11DRAFT_2236900 [Mycena galericulata]